MPKKGINSGICFLAFQLFRVYWLYGILHEKGLAQEEWRGEVVEVSWSPRAFLLKSFLSEKECQHFINKVRARTRTLNANQDLLFWSQSKDHRARARRQHA